MSTAAPYLLDTNVVLHATRQASPFSAAVDTQFQLRQSPFRPAICEVTVAELWAFAESTKWGEKRRQLLKRTINQCLVIPISRPSIPTVGRNSIRILGPTVSQFSMTITTSGLPRPPALADSNYFHPTAKHFSHFAARHGSTSSSSIRRGG